MLHILQIATGLTTQLLSPLYIATGPIHEMAHGEVVAWLAGACGIAATKYQHNERRRRTRKKEGTAMLLYSS